MLGTFSRKLAALPVVVMLLMGCEAGACVGARPLAMGGAFTGLADDVNATYWNPAGLTQLQTSGGTAMHTSTSRDRINYQDYAAAAFALGGRFAVGASWISTDIRLNSTRIDRQDWYWVSAAVKLTPTLSVGANIKRTQDSLPQLHTGTRFDLGVMLKVGDKLSVGMLVQDANSPSTRDINGGAPIAWARNYRPGLAYRPDKDSVVSLEAYDVLENGGPRSLRIGAERRVGRSLALRAGFYGIGDADASAFTFGAGKDGAKASTDVAVMLGDIDAVFASVSGGF